MDPAKAQSNRRKHGISFMIAQHVFSDPDAASRAANAADRPLDSWAAFSCCWLSTPVQNEGDDEIIRIISARRADRKEKKRYEKERQKNYR
jgi:uncharacterized DUF497 family protein